jgi:hypothetical protein
VIIVVLSKPRKTLVRLYNLRRFYYRPILLLFMIGKVIEAIAIKRIMECHEMTVRYAGRGRSCSAGSHNDQSFE